MTNYERLHAFTLLLWDVAELLRVKGRTAAADTVHAEAVHFAAERDIARETADFADAIEESSLGIRTVSFELPDGDSD